MVTASEMAYSQSKAHSKAWSFPFDSIDPAGADDYFVYLKNDGANDIVVHRITVESTVVGTVEVRGVTGTAGGSPTARTPVNKVINSSPAPDVTFSDDPDITGLTNVGVLEYIAIEAVSKDVFREFPEGIRIKTGQAVALLWDTATGILTGAIHAFEDSP